MGNTSSSQSSNSSMDFYSQDQIEDDSDRKSVNDKVKHMLRKTFRDLRILVVGRSRSGKSTLIRALLGTDDPIGKPEGQPEIQDIVTEWRHPDPALSLIIYESKPIDSIKYVEKFQNVHAVWYVVNAMDDEMLADNGLMDMLDRYGSPAGKGLPLLLIMTNNDLALPLATRNVRVNVEILENLLSRIKDEKKRKTLWQSMVRVLRSENGMEGMELIIDRTRLLIDKKLQMTWMACQVIDLDTKLEASLKLIGETQKQDRVASLESSHAQQLQLAAIFASVTHGLTSIWNVSDNVKKAIAGKFLQKERWEAVTQRISGAFLRALWIRLPRANHGVLHALMVLGCIFYIRAHAKMDRISSVEDYCQLCDEYIASRFAKQLSELAEEYNTSEKMIWEETSRFQLNVREVLTKIEEQKPRIHSSPGANDSDAETQNSESRAGDVHVRQRDGAGQDEDEESVDVYEMMHSNVKAKEMLHKTFRDVRILVVGRSGCGKSTLIRVLLGDEGPRSIAAGVAGKQNIMTEWRHPNPALPLVIHDTNGIDTFGNEKRADIEKFIDERLSHMSRKQFGERIHVVWYVISAMDDRVLEDCGMLEMLANRKGKELPLLMIMTNNDVARLLPLEYLKVNEEVLGTLLGRIKDETKRKRVRESMVRVGNRIKVCPESGKILDDESEVEMKGMEFVSERTKLLLDKELWMTWAASQVVDIDAKLEASSKLICETCELEALAGYFLSAIPIAQQLEMAAAFGGITRGLTSIWNVSKNQEKAFIYQLKKKRQQLIKQNLASNIAGAVVLGCALAATVFTGGAAAPTILLAGSPAVSQCQATRNHLAYYSLVFLGWIIYIRTHDTMHGQGSLQYYIELCDKFMRSSFAVELMDLYRHYTSSRGTVLPNDHMAAKIVDHFKKYVVETPIQTTLVG